jgi:gas vesicle protein
MAQQDDGVDKLRAMVARLQEYAQQVKQHTGTIESVREKLDEADDEAEDELGQLKEEVEAVQEELNDSESAALNEVWDLTGEAREIAHERLPEARQELTAAGDKFEEKVEEEGKELDSARQDLVTDGFEVADAASAAAEAELGQDRQEVEAAFATFREGVAESKKNLQDAVTDMVAKVAEATAKVTEREAALETEAKDSAEAFENKGAEFTGRLDKVSTAAGTLYDGVDEAVDTTVDTVEAMVESALKASADWAGEAGAQLGTSAEQASTGQAGHQSELETLDSALTNTGGLETAFEKLSNDLRRCAKVVDVIDQLLDAMKA